MRKIVLGISFVLATGIIFSSCREEKETVVREVEVEKESDEPEEREGIIERAGKKVDEEVNEEIDEEIEKIGDDN